MKKALLGAALLIAPFFSLANIYDNALGVNSDTTMSCATELSPSEAVAKYNADNGLPKSGPSWYQDARRMLGVKNTYYDTSSDFCAVYYEYSSSGGNINSDGSRQQTYNSTQTGQVNGNQVEVPTCLNLAIDAGKPFSESHTNLGYDSNGQPGCFTNQALADVDTCDVNSPWVPVGSNTSQFQCIEKEDNSQCRYEMKTANGQSWLQPSVEPDNCFTGDGTSYEEPNPPLTPPTGDNCQNIGNGITACPENPANVCDSNGLCQTGCGTVAFGGEEHFMCLSSDTDGDGLGDYADPDIDGDGIRNDEDLDRDGDGFEDPVYPIGNNSSQVQHQSNVETLLAQIAQNTNGSSGGGSNGNGQSPTAQEIGESVGEEVGDEIAEKLTEIGDFSTTNFEQSVDSKVEASNDSINQFLESEDSDLTNAFDQSDFEGSYNNLKSALAPTGCTADISIPFTSNKLDLCTPAAKAQPFLYVIFAIATFIYCVRRIQTTVRKD